MNTIIVGVGGGGGWLCALLSKSPGTRVALVDGDVVTKENLSRQLYAERDVGQPKVLGAARMLRESGFHQVSVYPEYLDSSGPLFACLRDDPEPARIFSCPDNHPARVACLALADGRRALGYRTVVGIVGNEYESAGADIYYPQWAGTKRDFRVRYPEVLTDSEGDPLRPSCTGEILQSKPQLALYNCLAAVSAAWLVDAWEKTVEKYAGSEHFKAIVDRLPVSIDWSAGTMTPKYYKEIADER